MNSTEKYRSQHGFNRTAALAAQLRPVFSGLQQRVTRTVTATLGVAAISFIAMPGLAANWDALALAERISECGKLTDSASRLDCYDRLNESLQVDNEASSGNKSFRPPDLELMLTESKKDALGRWVFYFDNGQIWRQTEKGKIIMPDGDAVPATLSPGILNSYNLRLGDSNRNIKVKRIN